MANKNLFKSILGKLLPKSDAVNEAGGAAYHTSNKHALAVYASTGCLNNTYYASADEQLAKVVALCSKVDAGYIAKVALYAREKGYMKDLPALLCAVLTTKGEAGARRLLDVFPRVIDSPKMLRNFVQIVRSGVTGRKSLGSLPKRLIKNWLESRGDTQLFTSSVGNDPSLADVIKMVHPKPNTPARAALYGYLVGRDHDADALPEIVKRFEAYKLAKDRTQIETPDVPFQMLTSLELAEWEWKAIARHAPWQMTRMNLNTFERHRVFQDTELVRIVADRLRNRELIGKARAFPYQLMVAYMNCSASIPGQVRDSLQDAMEIAIDNVPVVNGKVFVFPDVSGSMQSPITGHRKGSTSAVRCVDVAALVAAAMVRKNPTAEVVPFESNAITPDKFRLNPRDSVMTNAQKLASLPSGGTNCSAPLAYVNSVKAKGDLIVYVSDNESWVDTPMHGRFGGNATETMKQWSIFKQRNPQAKMICIDIQPYATTQAKERDDIINVAGFGDQVFSLIAAVAEGRAAKDYWVKQIEAMAL